jgi:hypothetical protein
MRILIAVCLLLCLSAAAPVSGIVIPVTSGYSGTLTITSQPTSNSVAQRDTRAGGALNKGKGAVSIGLNPSSAVGSLQYRLRDFASSSTTLVDWTDSGLGSLSSGSQTISLNIDADNHQFILDLRANNASASVVSTTNAFAVGEIICMAGQSQALQEIGDAGSNTYTINTTDGSHTVAAGTNRNITIGIGTWLNAQYRPFGQGSTPVVSGWLQPRDVTAPVWASMVGARLGALFVANEGVAFSLCGAATGNTPSSYWKSPGEGNTDLKTSITAIGGKFGAFHYYQATSDVGSASNWQTNVISIIDDLQTTYPSASFKKIITSVTSTTDGGAPEPRQLMKVAGQNVADHYNGIVASSAAYIPAFDLNMPNSEVHTTTWGDDTHALHIYRAWQKLYGENAYGDDGPQITGATRSGAVITLAVTQASGGTALVGTTNSAAPGGNTTPSAATLCNQFKQYVSPLVYDGSGNVTSTPLSCSTVTLAPTAITLTLSADPGAAAVVCYRLPPDASTTVVGTGIYDDNTAGATANLPNGRQLRFAPNCFTAS